MFEAVIFDWDETLANTKCVVVTSFQTVLKEINCNVTNEFISKLIGIGARNTLKEVLRTSGKPFDDELIERLLAKKIAMENSLSYSVKLFDGATALLSSLHKRIKLALATMNNRAVIEILLKEKQLEKFFSVVITADEVDRPKPDPEIFLKCAHLLKCLVERCVVVEDSIFGVRAAKQAEMKCVAIPSGAYSKMELMKENPDIIIDSLEDKTAILDFVLG